MSAEVSAPAPGAAPRRPALPEGMPRSTGQRLVRLHAASRRVPAAAAALAGCAVVLRIALGLHWVQGSGAGAQVLPLVIEAGAAVVIGATTSSPIGEPERATGRWLPWLRLGVVVVITGVAVGVLAAASAGAGLPGGMDALLRDVAGLTGVGLLSAVVLGGNMAWVGTIAYLAWAEYAVSAAWQNPWTWPARPPHDTGAALCAAGVFAAGVVAVAIRGARREGPS